MKPNKTAHLAFCGVGDRDEKQYVSESIHNAGITGECASVGPVAQ
ncbi:hypothetical protein BSS2_I1972 [Brucella suis bv. 1 str. S2]|uniref:Uncharacterized protein n=6 Tax=Brucella TaxID=234 RepID=Q57AL9_BRUAB|nr:hypothetical protein BR2038 [Brucella suis 1330]AAX75315.1 hypothetical protein BruAb1_2013 [Brucella abortus bv. 1 str. 9-941]ABX63070.1 Hypothetical protein, conserved [Brucella canis ATCC 23365]ABY38891.1 Hypothetical protein, conserved [Brucella suis ATCC 23445]ACO01750.1 Hypothetical protein, conserved [Brucella melitensis ATCC 23457]ACU48998.1 hypothetical protein BMI_I2059 [Brucella microti CCM 4915]AEK55318.1 hypothetical protein BPI_I2095 [Brucella pinnipedialis B2/94]AEU07015.1 